MEIVGRKATDAKDKVNNLLDRLGQETFGSYSSIRNNVDQSLFAVASCLKDLIDREPQELQQSVHIALRNAASSVQKWSVNAAGVAGRRLSLIVGHARPDELAKPGSSTTHLASRESGRSQARPTFSKKGALKGNTPQSSVSALLCATDPRNYPGRH